jgi:hypothetical protein
LTLVKERLLPKYYVSSGQIEGIIVRDTPYLAALFVIEHFGRGKLPHYLTKVSEKGYEDLEAEVFITDEILQEIYNGR